MYNESSDFSCPDTPEELNAFSDTARTVPQEASSDWRATAVQARQFFISLRESGFTEEQALSLVAVVIKTVVEQGLSQE